MDWEQLIIEKKMTAYLRTNVNPTSPISAFGIPVKFPSNNLIYQEYFNGFVLSTKLIISGSLDTQFGSVNLVISAGGATSNATSFNVNFKVMQLGSTDPRGTYNVGGGVFSDNDKTYSAIWSPPSPIPIAGEYSITLSLPPPILEPVIDTAYVGYEVFGFWRLGEDIV